MMLPMQSYNAHGQSLSGAPPKTPEEMTSKELTLVPREQQQTVSEWKAEELSIKFADPVAALIKEADGYAAQLITAGALKQADYDTQKATAKGAAWTVASATAWRDSTKKALDDYNAKKGESGGAGWLLPVGIAAAAFLALRK